MPDPHSASRADHGQRQEQSPSDQLPKTSQQEKREKQSLLHRWADNLGILASLLALATAFFAFFPHLTLSDPVTINPDQLLSKYMTVTNDGILPVYRVRCQLAPRSLLSNSGNGITGPIDFSFRIQMSNCYIGTLSPGDGYTFTLEQILDLPTAEAQANADFAIAISYVPFFPPIRMDNCTHFVLHTSMNGDKQWFRSPGRCALFPWIHGHL
jgi:hypothetical protein